MPILTSIERLARFYEDDTNYFTLLLVSYAVSARSGARLLAPNGPERVLPGPDR